MVSGEWCGVGRVGMCAPPPPAGPGPWRVPASGAPARPGLQGAPERGAPKPPGPGLRRAQASRARSAPMASAEEASMSKSVTKGLTSPSRRRQNRGIMRFHIARPRPTAAFVTDLDILQRLRVFRTSGTT
ncbi:hypothetical protein HMPREF9062_0584 [Actinomyces sp. oral taxon 448 str. F0400]|nr:hypothetical protein HMPREF9062_0584 [Actinomyces sp. oral taxon 448 str. F0400]